MNMKKIIAVISCLCMTGSIGQFPQNALFVNADTEETLEYQYSEHITIQYAVTPENTVNITRVLLDGQLTENEKTLKLPEKLSECPVTEIGEIAFEGVRNVTSVTLPKQVTTIGSAAFQGCMELEKIVLPNTVTTIGKQAFLNDENLSSVNMPKNLVTIGDSAFTGCKALTSVTLPETLQTIGEYAFCRSGLTSVTIPGSVKTIEKQTFQNCYSLKTVVLEDGVEVVKSDAFSAGTAVTSLSLSQTLTKIESSGFHLLDIETIVIPKSTVSIAGAFTSNELKEVYVLNPACEVSFPSASHVSTLYGYVNSPAQKYADDRSNIAFVPFGDADGNGEIDILDVITLNKAIMGKETLSETGLKAIDFNGNGKPDSNEATNLLKYLVGLITDLNA